jgi:hypothetical protein
VSGYQEKFYFNPGDTGFKVIMIPNLYYISLWFKLDIHNIAVAVIVIGRNLLSEAVFY